MGTEFELFDHSPADYSPIQHHRNLPSFRYNEADQTRPQRLVATPENLGGDLVSQGLRAGSAVIGRQRSPDAAKVFSCFVR